MNRKLLKNPTLLQKHIQLRTAEKVLPDLVYPEDPKVLARASAVLFLMGYQCCGNGAAPEPCLILNKRSTKVRQPGDLCCPGGGIMPSFDPFMAEYLNLPGFPMAAWPFWKKMNAGNPKQAAILRSLLFTSLRESFEEMRLVPFDVRFLGPLLPQELILFRRMIYPMSGWVGHQKRFMPNWEVEKIVYIPLRKLLDPGSYVRYQFAFRDPGTGQMDRRVYDTACFLHQETNGFEVLWGATCRITLNFLDIVFGFSPPDLDTLPLVEAEMDESYVGGKA